MLIMTLCANRFNIQILYILPTAYMNLRTNNESLFFDVCMSVHHHTVQINQPIRCNSFTSLLLDVYVWLNMFRAPLRPSSGAYNCTRSLWFYRWSVVGRGLQDHDQQRSSRFSPTVKPEAPSAVVCSWWWAGKHPKHAVPHVNVK